MWEREDRREGRGARGEGRGETPGPMSHPTMWMRALSVRPSRVVLRVARIPRVRILLQRKWPIWGKLLVKNKVRAEVTSYRLVGPDIYRSPPHRMPLSARNEDPKCAG